MPVIYNFWETVLLHTAGYSGNVIAKHIAIDRQISLQDEHYKKWLELWAMSVDSRFTGEIAENAKKKAHSMMQLISMKVQWAREGKSIL